MTANSLSPAFIKFSYGYSGSLHTMTLPTKINGSPVPGGTNNLENHIGAARAFALGLDDLSILLKPYFASTVTLLTGSLWSQPTPNDDPVWLEDAPINDAGTGSGATVVASETVMTFRTSNGGLWRLYLMETINEVDQRILPAAFDSTAAALVTYLTGSLSWVYGRDNGKPVACLGLITKTNDVLRRKLLTG